jgi:U3 small nucleolar RNA-associated protein 21
MFNMQSGLHRQSFPARAPAGRTTKSNAQASVAAASKHTKAVTGLMIDSLNRTVVSCGLDGKVKVRPVPPFRPFTRDS